MRVEPAPSMRAGWNGVPLLGANEQITIRGPVERAKCSCVTEH